VTATINTFNVGVDLSITISDQNGLVVQLDGPRDMFEEQADDEYKKGRPGDGGGKITQRVIPGGWSGSIEAEKAVATFAQRYSSLEQLFYAGGQQQFFTINCTLRSPLPGGPTERWMLSNVVFHGYKPGTHVANDMTKSKVEWGAQERIEL
jgi:hypothetical protein